MLQLVAIVLLNLFPVTSQVQRELKLSETEKWKLSWRMIISSMEKNYELGELQFDSLLMTKSKTDKKFILTGLEILKKNSKEETFTKILKGLDSETLEFLCGRNLINKTSTEFSYS